MTAVYDSGVSVTSISEFLMLYFVFYKVCFLLNFTCFTRMSDLRSRSPKDVPIKICKMLFQIYHVQLILHNSCLRQRLVFVLCCSREW